MASADTMLLALGDDINTGGISAVINALAALSIVYIMMAVTADAGFSGRLNLIKLGHRLALASLAVALAVNAGVTVASPGNTRLVDVIVQGAMLIVVAFSAWRHTLVPPPGS